MITESSCRQDGELSQIMRKWEQGQKEVMKEGLEKRKLLVWQQTNKETVTLLSSQSRVDLSPALRLLKSILPEKTLVKMT